MARKTDIPTEIYNNSRLFVNSFFLSFLHGLLEHLYGKTFFQFISLMHARNVRNQAGHHIVLSGLCLLNLLQSYPVALNRTRL